MRINRGTPGEKPLDGILTFQTVRLTYPAHNEIPTHKGFLGGHASHESHRAQILQLVGRESGLKDDAARWHLRRRRHSKDAHLGPDLSGDGFQARRCQKNRDEDGVLAIPDGGAVGETLPDGAVVAEAVLDELEAGPAETAEEGARGVVEEELALKPRGEKAATQAEGAGPTVYWLGVTLRVAGHGVIFVHWVNTVPL